MEGILPVYKPVGMSSYDVIREWKRCIPPSHKASAGKVGHGGTLDPFAEGVLLLLIGRSATKRMDELGKLPKTYVATAVLGASSDTLDCTGELVVQSFREPAGLLTSGSVDQWVGRSASQNFGLSESQITDILPKFTGEIVQKIPDYSAAKVGGKPRYLLARQGEVLQSKSKTVQVSELSANKIDDTTYQITTTVSSGTYIRQLSYDIFKAMGVESYLSKLVRTRIGEFEISKCATIDELKNNQWQGYLIGQTQGEAQLPASL